MRVSKLNDLKQSTTYAGICPTLGGKCWVRFHHHRVKEKKASPNHREESPTEPTRLQGPAEPSPSPCPYRTISSPMPSRTNSLSTYYRSKQRSTHYQPIAGPTNTGPKATPTFPGPRHHRTNTARPDYISPGPPATIYIPDPYPQPHSINRGVGIQQ